MLRLIPQMMLTVVGNEVEVIGVAFWPDNLYVNVPSLTEFLACPGVSNRIIEIIRSHA